MLMTIVQFFLSLLSGFNWIVPKVCYDHVGCFNVSYPYNNANYLLPQSPDVIQTRFYLYTQLNTAPESLNPYVDSTITNSEFSGQRPTKFIIHGYRENANSSWIKAMTAAILSKEDANVIAVDWSEGTDRHVYAQSAANTRVVGATIANLITSLLRLKDLSLTDVHMIGHSLGSHIAGFAGTAVPGCGRISGLDPAGPLFENKDPLVRLDPADALFVEAIHTDGEKLSDRGFGLQQPVGHADFYPNGGQDQQGCPTNHDNVFTSLGTSNAMEDFSYSLTCSHLRVVDLYTESITSECVFKALPCDSKAAFDNGQCDCSTNCQYVTMGYGSSSRKFGTFYLKTGGTKPFCLQ